MFHQLLLVMLWLSAAMMSRCFVAVQGQPTDAVELPVVVDAPAEAAIADLLFFGTREKRKGKYPIEYTLEETMPN